MHIFKFSCGSTILCTLHVVLYAGVSTRLLISTAAAMQVGSLQHTRRTLMLLLHPRFCQVLSISTQLQCCYLVQSINLLCTTLVFATVLHSAPLLHSCSDASRQPVKHMMKPLLAVTPQTFARYCPCDGQCIYIQVWKSTYYSCTMYFMYWHPYSAPTYCLLLTAYC